MDAGQEIHSEKFLVFEKRTFPAKVMILAGTTVASLDADGIFIECCRLLSVVDIKFDDLTDIWQSILDNPVAGPYAFNYLRNNWETLYEE